MKLRGGQWVADTSDAEALAAALDVSAMAPLKIEEPTTTLFSNAGNDEQRLTQGEIESHSLELTEHFIKAVMQWEPKLPSFPQYQYLGWFLLMPPTPTHTSPQPPKTS